MARQLHEFEKREIIAKHGPDFGNVLIASMEEQTPAPPGSGQQIDLTDKPAWPVQVDMLRDLRNYKTEQLLKETRELRDRALTGFHDHENRLVEAMREVAKRREAA